MADQIEIQLPKTYVTEADAFEATAYFRIRSTAAADTPTTVHYRIDNVSENTNLQDWTSLTPGTSVSIPITASHNTIRRNHTTWETRQLIVQSDRGTDTQSTGAVSWRVKNLQGINHVNP